MTGAAAVRPGAPELVAEAAERARERVRARLAGELAEPDLLSPSIGASGGARNIRRAWQLHETGRACGMHEQVAAALERARQRAETVMDTHDRAIEDLGRRMRGNGPEERAELEIERQELVGHRATAMLERDEYADILALAAPSRKDHDRALWGQKETLAEARELAARVLGLGEPTLSRQVLAGIAEAMGEPARAAEIRAAPDVPFRLAGRLVGHLAARGERLEQVLEAHLVRTADLIRLGVRPDPVAAPARRGSLRQTMAARRRRH